MVKQVILRRCLVPVFFSLAACTSQGSATHKRVIDPIGYFEYRAPLKSMRGVVIGAPRGGMVPGAASMAKWISDETGAGFVAAYGFRSRGISVERPVIRSDPHQPILPQDPPKRLSVFREFKSILHELTSGEIGLYVGLGLEPGGAASNGIEVIASGFSFEELRWLDRVYEEIRDRVIGKARVEKLPLLIASVDELKIGSSAVKHHGVLLIAEKGLILGIPENALSGATLAVYRRVFSEWLKAADRLVHEGPLRAARVKVKLMDLGRFDVIPSRIAKRGIVIGAPHGTYDEYTAEIAMRLAFRTGLAGVIARGFTPTEAGGWRINVNRPTEKTFLAPEFEASTSRSREVYNGFKKMVLGVAGGDLALYVDLHQYGRDDTIQVATVGLDREQARKIKQSYRGIRDRLLKEHAGVKSVDLVIEPFDVVEVGAWPAKHTGMLSVAQKSLHIELPLHSALASEKSRSVYTRVIAELITLVADDLCR